MNDKQDVLFAFDDLGIETTRGVRLEMVRPDKYPGNPILARGKAGEPDEHRAHMPAVIHDNGLWRMWYIATASRDYHKSLVGYVESDDGITWRKPELGLCEHNGSKRNNLVRTVRGLVTVSVLCDEEAPPEYRYVMAGEDMIWWTPHTLQSPPNTRVDVSADGLRWTPLRDEGIIPQIQEAGTTYKFKGNYHIGGQQVSPVLRLPMQTYPTGRVHMLGPRTFVIWRSPRIDRWPLENTKSFFKPMRSSSPYLNGWDGEQVHLGASVTPYRNVCLGVYGQWHHPPLQDEEGWETKYDGNATSVDLGLLISNDGLHFREPAPGFTLVARDQELRWDRDRRDHEDKDNILLIQGPMINTDGLTHLYYGASTPGGNVAEVNTNIGLATWPRDRFGYLSLIDEKTTGQFASCPLEYKRDMKLYVNGDIPPGSSLQVYLLDEHGLDVLPGYGEADGGQITESGLDVDVIWRDRPFLPTGQPFKIRCEITGTTRIFALYMRDLN